MCYIIIKSLYSLFVFVIDYCSDIDVSFNKTKKQMLSNQINLCVCVGNHYTFLNEFIISDGSNGNLSVICGSSLATELPITTTSTTTTTTIATPSTATSRLSSEVSSTKPTAAIIQNDVNVTESTGTTLSEECTFICGRKDKVTGNCMYHFLTFAI